MYTKIILLEQINKLGKLGDTINVKKGYARNFLIPKKKACFANNLNILNFKLKELKIRKIAIKKKEIAQIQAQKINNLTITIYKNSSINGNLFGSINKIDILLELKKKKIFIKKNQIKLSYNFIKSTGKYNILISLYDNINVNLKLFVLKKNKNI